MKKERDAREKKARERAKAAAAATASAAAAKATADQHQQPAAHGAAKRGGPEPPAGEPAAKREAIDDGATAGPSGRAFRGAANAADAAGAAAGTRTVAAPAAAAGGTATPTEAQLSAMTKAALVDRARRAGLAVGGAKAALVARLVEHYRTRRGG